MTDAQRSRTSIAGPVLIVAGIVLAVMLFWQPWASCEDEDSSAGCAVPTELIGWTSAGWAVAAAAVVVGAILTARAGRPPHD
ncbi:hypothetical protein [Cellulomonas sp. KH9]|uniref:hypothetical protein n=1 Tax=Cellulomonas sp. KH9 TaxID=1855324 RepID=UPI000B7D60B5|nr:hypothetical protein [Cellulomonas sp. KH9]